MKLHNIGKTSQCCQCSIKTPSFHVSSSFVIKKIHTLKLPLQSKGTSYQTGDDIGDQTR